MSWLVNISEKLSDLGNQISSNQPTNNEAIGSDFSLIVSLKKEIEILQADKLQLEKSIEELDQQHEEYLQNILKSKDDLIQENKSLQQTIINMKISKDSYQVDFDNKAIDSPLIEKIKATNDINKNSKIEKELVNLNLNSFDQINCNTEIFVDFQKENQELKNLNLKMSEKINYLSDISQAYDLLVMSNDNLVSQNNDLKDTNLNLKEQLAQLSKNHSHIQNTEKQLKHLKMEIESLKDNNSKLKEISMQNENTEGMVQLSKLNEDLKLKISLLEQTNQELNEFKTASISKLDQLIVLEKSLSSSKSENESLKDSLLDMTNTNRSLSIELEELKLSKQSNEEIKSDNISYEKNVTNLNDTIKLLNVSNIENKRLNEELEKQNELLRNRITELENNEINLLKKFEFFETSNAKLLKENESFKINITELERKEEDNVSKFEELMKYKSDNVDENNIMQKKIIDLQEQAEKFVIQISQMQVLNEALIKDKNNLQNSNDVLNIEISKLQEQVEKFVIQISQMQVLNEALLKDKNNLQKSNDVLNEEIGKLREQVEKCVIQISQMQVLNEALTKDKNNLQNSNDFLKEEIGKLQKSFLEREENHNESMNLSQNTGAVDILGKTDSEKVLENKVEELTTSLKLFQDKCDKLQGDNKWLEMNKNENITNLSTRENNVDYLSKISDENVELKKNLDELLAQKNILETSINSAKNEYELGLKNENIKFEQRFSDLQNQMSVSLFELEKLRADKRQLENRLSNLTDDYTSVLEKLSKNNLENKDIVAKTFLINELMLKLFDKLKIQRQQGAPENSLQVNLQSNANILFEFVEKNFIDFQKVKNLESEVENLRILLQKSTAEFNFTNEKFEDASKQIFVLQQKLSCSRSDILMATEQHKKQLIESQAKYSAEKQNIQIALNELSTKNMVLQTQLDTHLSDYTDKITKALEEKNTLQAKLNESVEKYEKIYEEKCLLDEKVDGLSNEIAAIQNLDHDRVKSESNTTTELNYKLEKALKENNRLKNHLAELEESHTKEIIELSTKEIQLLDKIKDLETQLLIFTDKAKNNDLSNSQMYLQLDSDIKTAINELELSRKKCKDQERLIEELKTSNNNLQQVLEEFHKNSTSAEIVELEKTKKLLISEKDSKDKVIQKCSQLEDELKNLKENENKYLKSLNEIKTEQKEFIRMKQTVVIKEELISSLENRLASIKTDSESKIEKLVIKNLLLGYFHAPNTKKVEVLNVVGHILDFSAEDFKLLNCKDTTRWLDHVMFSTDSNSKNQSFMELFVKFLEKESTPPRFISMSTALDQSHTGVLNRSNSNQSQQAGLNSGQSDQSNVSLSRYLATLQQQRSFNIDQGDIKEDSVPNPIE